MSEKPQSDPRTVILNNVRLSFTDSLKDKKATVEDGEPKHSCNFILEADKPEFEDNKAKVMSAIRAACEQEWKKEDFWKTIQEDDPKRIAYRKGERFKNKETQEVYAGYAGNMAISASGPRGGRERPKLMDRHKRDVAYEDIPTVCYSGSYADVKLSFFGTTKGGNGIFCTIEGIRSRQEGERIGGGGGASADDFDDLPDNSFDGGSKSSSGSGIDDDGIG